MVQQVLRALRLKGVANAELLAKALRVSANEVAEQLRPLVSSGLVKELPRGFSLTPDGRTALSAELKVERDAIDRQEIDRLYELLCGLNVSFKRLMTDWQIRSVDGKEVPNTHEDAAYDGAIVDRLRHIHDDLQPLLEAVIRVVPRLGPYRPRFDESLAAIKAGDRTMMAGPIKDSYHTLWFELHEEFIDLCGRTRAGEAAAGRGD